MKVMTNTMKKHEKNKMSKICIIFSFLLFGFCIQLWGQTNNIYQSQNFRLGEAHYRVAELTQLADTVLIWGDVQLPGTYLVPRGINIAQMLAYSKGPINLRTQETDLDWSNVFVEVTITNGKTGQSILIKQEIDGTIDAEFFSRTIENFDTIIIRVKRKPNFLDYVRAYVPIVATVLNTLLLYRTIKDL
jgi:hypothetical protein